MKTMKLTLIIISLIMLPILLLAGVNLSMFDEELEQPLKDILTANRHWQDESNAYTYIYGIHTDSETEVKQHAAQVTSLIQAKAEVLRDFDGDEALTALMAEPEEDKQWLDSLSSLNCKFPEDLDCFNALLAQSSQIDFKNGRIAVMLQRYRIMLGKQMFIEPEFMNMHSPIANLRTPMRLGILSLAIAYNEGEGAFIDQLAIDVQFWRMVLRQSESLIGKMVANAVLHRNLSFLSYFIREQALNDELFEKTHSILSPLQAEELDISEAFYGELRMVANSSQLNFDFISSAAMKKLLSALAYQPNATLNDFYQFYIEPSTIIAKLNGQKLWELMLSPESESKSSELNTVLIDSAKSPEATVFPPTVYNLAGKLTLEHSIEVSADYIARSHNLDGMFRLVTLQLLSEREDISSALKAASLSNPFNGEAMTMTDDSSELWFACFKKSEAACRVPL